ncbi:MAG: SRPBCC domain-containing protein [Gemmatimonadales bacterium]
MQPLGPPREIHLTVARKAVWKAITDPLELARWFAPAARVTPGADGKVCLEWPGVGHLQFRVTIWNRPTRLRLELETPRADGVVLDFQLRGTGHSTRLRVAVESTDAWSGPLGLLAGDDAEWELTLLTLRHYLEYHRGHDRTLASVTSQISGNGWSAWNRLTVPGGLFGPRGLPDTIPGRRFRVEPVAGEGLRGRLLVSQPPDRLLGVLDTPQGSLFRCEVLSGAEGTRVRLRLSAWGSAAAEVARVESQWREGLPRLVSATPEVSLLLE